jgi:putative transposase
MPEHVHLLLSEPAEETVAQAMQLLKTRVSIQARRENHRTASGSPFWQTRYYDHNVRNNQAFSTQLRYIHRNPVKRGLCNTPQDWPWSSFRAWASGEVGVVEVESDLIAARREASSLHQPHSGKFCQP